MATTWGGWERIGGISFSYMHLLEKNWTDLKIIWHKWSWADLLAKLLKIF